MLLIFSYSAALSVLTIIFIQRMMKRD